MKRNNNIINKVKIIAVFLVFAMTLGACKGTKTAENTKIPAATYMGGDNTLAEVRKELSAAGVSHVDTFEEWVSDFADTAGKEAKLEDNWSAPEKLNADISKCMDGWEDYHDFSDADCRMTAFLLLDGLLKADSTEENYQGTYLMFDTEAIDSVERYALLREHKDMFTTLFGEKSIVDEAHPETTFSDSWKQYGYQIDNDKISLVSVVIQDPYEKVVFVGHTGILIKCEDYYLFVEKIAFEQPYQVTKVNSMDELLTMLSARPEYFGEEGEAGPFVYNNGEYVGTLKQRK